MDLDKFDPELTGTPDNGLFGIPTTLENSLIALIPVPWEVTTSYGGGASMGPQAILNASPQLDLFDIHFGETWRKGFHWLPEDKGLASSNEKLKKFAQIIIHQLETNGALSAESVAHIEEINRGCKEMVRSIYYQSVKLLNQGKLVGVVGGDHSSPEGLMQAILDFHKEEDIGILHIDAHCDLRKAYQGFEHSHASIMFNVLNHPNSPSQLVQMGIRDFSKIERDLALSDSRVHTFWDRECQQKLASGTTWVEICQKALEKLPHKVYVSFDIDGLSPEFCPSTGTPVPGGLSYDQALILLSELGQSGKEIVGFDLNEVAPSPSSSDDWDGNVGARILFQLCGWAAQSKK